MMGRASGRQEESYDTITTALEKGHTGSTIILGMMNFSLNQNK